MSYQNKLNNINAANFDIEALSNILKTVRSTHKSALSIDADREEAQERLTEAQGKLQEAVNKMDYDAMGKYNATCKRLEAKLAENPIERIQAFDAAVNELVAFTTNEPALTVVDTEETKRAA